MVNLQAANNNKILFQNHFYNFVLAFHKMEILEGCTIIFPDCLNLRATDKNDQISSMNKTRSMLLTLAFHAVQELFTNCHSNLPYLHSHVNSYIPSLMLPMWN